MILPNEYNIKSCEQKSDIIRQIGDVLMRIDEEEFPNICSQLYNDNSKVELIEVIILNMFSPNGVSGDMNKILSSIEVTLND